MTKKKLSDLIDYIAELQSQGYMARADLDTILIMKDAFEKQLPPRFNNLVQKFDKRFDSVPLLGSEDHEEFLDRLIAMYNTSKDFPNSQTLNLDDELIPTFELDANDKGRVVELCSQMRKIVFSSETFDQPHKRRLLNRIAAIEKQIEQPKGMLDVIRGGVSDIGETLGRFGVDIKPLTDRMNEVMQITRASSEEYKQLPPPEEVKRLPKPSEEEKGDSK